MHLDVWRAFKKLELLSAAPRATLTLLSCSPNLPRASTTPYTHVKHEPILQFHAAKTTVFCSYEKSNTFLEDMSARFLNAISLTSNLFRYTDTHILSHCGIRTSCVLSNATTIFLKESHSMAPQTRLPKLL